jgi:hypothetical protein
MLTSRALALALLALLALGGLVPAAVAGVIVVDPPTGPTAQAAIDAAAPGDILLLKPSASDPAADLVIDGKGLTLVADGADIGFHGLKVQNVPAGQQVTVRGVTLSGPAPFWPAASALSIFSCAGSVWFDTCTVTSPDQISAGFLGWAPEGPAGTNVSACSSVLFTGCQLSGGRGASAHVDCTISGNPGSVGGAGIAVAGSSVVLHDTTCTGGGGGSGGQCTVSQDGGAGVSAKGASSVHIAASVLTGGIGSSPAFAGVSGGAGSGLLVADAASTVTRRDSTVVHGSWTPFNPDVDAPVGTVSGYPAPARTLALTSPLREGQAGSLTIDGQTGDLVALFMAFTGGHLPLSGKQGVFSLGSPFFGPFVLGNNPSGLWTVPFNAPPLMPASLQGQAYLLQLVVHDGSQVLFEGASTLTVIDSTIP